MRRAGDPPASYSDDPNLARAAVLRVRVSTLPLTQSFYRSCLVFAGLGVTEALKALRAQGLISYGRGLISVEDRKGMERAAKPMAAL